MYREEKAEDNKQRMIEAAFIAWQLKETKKSFKDYLRILGLVENSSNFKRKSKAEDLAKYRRILEKVKKASK